MQWETILLLLLAAPFVLYYVIRDRIEGIVKNKTAARQES
jgi:hypothetical protein